MYQSSMNSVHGHIRPHHELPGPLASTPEPQPQDSNDQTLFTTPPCKTEHRRWFSLVPQYLPPGGSLSCTRFESYTLFYLINILRGKKGILI